MKVLETSWVNTWVDFSVFLFIIRFFYIDVFKSSAVYNSLLAKGFQESSKIGTIGVFGLLILC